MIKHHVKQHKWKVGFIAFGSVFLFLWLLKAPVMSAYFSSKMGVPVYLGTIDIWPRKTLIYSFNIKNPPNFGLASAFESKHVKIGYKLNKLLGASTEIDLIELDQVFINIELLEAGKGNNWESFTGQLLNKKPQKAMIIHRLVINGLTAEIHGKGAIAMGIAGTRHFDHLELNEINSAEGFPTKQVAGQIFEGAGLEIYLEKFFNPVESVEETINPLNFF